jgi:hypothetical protein
MIYYLLISILFIFSLFQQINLKKDQLKLLKYFSVTLLIIIGGLRFEVGADWFAYKKLFLAHSNYSSIFNAREEKLFMFLMVSIKNIINSYSFFIFILFNIAFLLKVKILNYYSKDIFLSLLVYVSAIFLYFDLNGIRQGLAISIVLLSIPYILNKNIYKYLFLILMAIFCHTSAIIFLPFYWIANIRFKKKYILQILTLVVVFSIPLREFVLNSSLLDYLFTFQRLSGYEDILFNPKKNTVISIFSLAVFQRFVILFLFLFYYKKLKCDKKLKNLLLNGYVISLMIFLILSFSAEFAARLGFYYKSLELLIIPLIVSSQIKIINKVFLLILFLIYAIIAVYRLLSVDGNALIPYNLYFL